MQNAVAWLPPPGKGDIESALARLIENWLSEWFIEPVSLRVQPRSRGEFRSLQWRGKTGAMVGSNADAVAQLGRCACGGEGDIANPADREFLCQVGTKLLDELILLLGNLAVDGDCEMQSLSAVIPNGDLFTVTPVAAGWSLGLALSPLTLVAVRKAASGSSRTVRPRSLRDAFGPQVVRLGCHLGKAGLTAGDVALLAAGDVIVFDRQAGDPLALTIEGNACALGKAKIVRSAEGASITIAERPNLLRKVGKSGES